jgi:hypothetical protein
MGSVRLARRRHRCRRRPANRSWCAFTFQTGTSQLSLSKNRLKGLIAFIAYIHPDILFGAGEKTNVCFIFTREEKKFYGVLCFALCQDDW